MKTRFITSPDVARMAYHVSGQGPALMLLHGAGKTRKDWHKAGYVKRLETDFTVITVDIHGSGESEFLTKISDFSIPNISSRYSPMSRSRITLPAISSCFHSTVSNWKRMKCTTRGWHYGVRRLNVSILAFIDNGERK